MKRFIVTIFFTFFASSVSSVYAEELDFETVIQRALENSFDVKISQTDIKISDTAIQGAKSEYYPKISTYFYSEYTKSLDGNNQTVYIGNEVLYGNSVFQNSLSVGLNYNLFDFGIRGDRLKIAKSDKVSKIAQYNKILRDTEITAVEAYAKSLILYKQKILLSQVVTLQHELFSDKERLYQAGKIPQTAVLEEKIKWNESKNELEKVNAEFEKSIKDIAFLTNTEPPQNPILKDFVFEEKEKITISDLNPDTLPETKIYDAEIVKKQKELLIAKKQNLPTFNFTTNYYLYGADPNNYFDAYDSFRQRGLKFRIIASLPIFDGFKNKSDRDRLKLEIERLYTEKEKKVAEVKYNYEKARDDTVYANILHENNISMKNLLSDNISMFDRLSEQKLIDRNNYLQQKISLLNKYFEIEKTDINQYVSAFKVDVLANNIGENI